MEDIVFKAAFGDTTKEVRISMPLGAGGILDLTMDNYYYGLFVWYEGRWQFRPQKKEDFTKDDIDIIEGIVNERVTSPYK